MSLIIKGVLGDNIEEVVIKSPPSDVKKSYKLMVKADALRLNALFKESVKHYLSAIMMDRENVLTYIGLSQSYRQLEEYEKAVDILQRAQEIEPKNSKLAFELGVCFMSMGLFCMALINLREAILLDKDNIDAKLQLGIAHELIEEYDLALMVYQKIIDDHPSFLKAYQHKAALLMDLKLYNESASVFAQLMKINPKFHKAYLGVGICYDKCGRIQSAIRYYRKFLKMKPNSKNAPDVQLRLEKIMKNRAPVTNPLKAV